MHVDLPYKCCLIVKGSQHAPNKTTGCSSSEEIAVFQLVATEIWRVHIPLSLLLVQERQKPQRLMSQHIHKIKPSMWLQELSMLQD